MHRLFVAIRPPREVRERLLGIMGGVRNARWQGDEQLHLTLKFIGEVDRHQAEDIAAALGAVHQPRFEIALSGVGRFEQRGGGILWAGVMPHEALRALQKKIDQACLRVGIEPETRAFHAHITLARLNRSSGPTEPFLEQWAGLSAPSFEVNGFCLYESRLGAEGASYTIAARYPLA